MLLAQRGGYTFYNKTQWDGLSHNFCFSVLRDSRGLMWIGTNNGLSRYDGYHFYNFYARQDSNSFMSNSVLDLCEDKEGDIWGATSNGIFCYKVRQNKFINYIPPGYDYAPAVNNIICDRGGNIWATGLWTILRLNKRKGIFEEIGPLTKNKDSLGYYSVRQNGMVEDPGKSGIWMATRTGLHYYDIPGNKFYNYKNMPGDSIFVKRNVVALSVSRFGYVWMFDNSTKNIIAFDPSSRKLLHQLNVQKIIPDAIGQTLYEDSNHQLWFSTWNDKMAVIDYRNNTFTSIAYKSDNPLSIAGDNFWSVFEDDNNTIWLGTAGGLSRCNYSKNIYSIYPVSEKVKEFDAHKLGAVSVDPRDGSLWIASESYLSVIHYYPESGKYSLYDFKDAQKNSKGQLPYFVFDINFINDQPHIVTHTGTWVINEKTSQLFPFTKKFRDLPDLSFSYLGRNKDYFWISTEKGLVKWNPRTEESKLVKAPTDILPDSQRVNYSLISFDRKGNPWIVPAFGWLAHVTEDDQVDLFYYIKDKLRERSSYVRKMQFDSKGKLWIASLGAGIYRYDPESKKIDLFDRFEGIGTSPSTLLVDKEDRIWMLSSQIIAVYNQQTGRVSSYYLPLNENTSDYNPNIAMGPDGSVFFTLNKSVARFIPDRLNLKPAITSPVISLVEISGKEKHIIADSLLYLKPDQNSLEFDFGSLINQEVFPYHFEYRLDGFDKDWSTAGNSASALYSNLQPGDYVFRVKAVSKNKTWETPERIISITISTPFYKARWFWLLMGALLIATLIFFYRFRLNKQRQILTLETKSQELEKEKTMAMYEGLKQQLNPHFLFNSLSSLSGLIESDQQLAGTFLKQMSKIYRYILKSGDSETVRLKEELDFVSTYINLQKTRFEDGLQVVINVDEESMRKKIPPVTLQNMVENAIKHNVVDNDSPLIIQITVEADYIVVKNNLQRKNVVETSNKQGLKNLKSLYSYLSSKPMIIEEDEKEFRIKIPLI